MHFVIQYPKPTSTALPSYHTDALAPPKPPAPPPPFPIKVPQFAQKLAKKFDGLKTRFNQITNPQVRVARTQGTLSGDMSGNNKQLTLKVPFDTSSAHWFENVPPKAKASKPK